MNKDELVELLAKSQDAVLERVNSKLQELKRSISEDQEECLRSVVKKVKEDHSINNNNNNTLYLKSTVAEDSYRNYH